MNAQIKQIVQEVNKAIKGKEDVIQKVLAAILAGGHVLLEDIPGVGKTTLAVALGKTMDMEYKRMQFTPDVLPSDIVGFMMYNAGTKDFEYRKGAVFTNLFLADEINRTSSKTQSALLEVMEEKKVTVEGVTHELPSPFFVIATENPIGSAGTQMLPESQLDRFLVCLTMGYPSHSAALEILKGNEEEPLKQVQTIIRNEQLAQLQRQTKEMFVSDNIYEYIVKLTEETRKNEYVSLGISPRGSIALLKMAKAMAVIHGGSYVVPEDVLYVIQDVWGHRLKVNVKAKSEGIGVPEVITQITERVRVIS